MLVGVLVEAIGMVCFGWGSFLKRFHNTIKRISCVGLENNVCLICATHMRRIRRCVCTILNDTHMHITQK